MTYNEAIRLALATANATGQWVEIWTNGYRYSVCIKGSEMPDDYVHYIDISPAVKITNAKANT